MKTKINEIIKLKKSKFQSLGVLFKKNDIELFELIKNSFTDTDNFSEKLFRVLNDIEKHPMCEYCKKNKVGKFKDFSKGYDKSCSRKCAANNKDRLKKTRETNIEKYGCESPLQNSEVRAKSVATLRERYGKEITNPGKLKKARKTMKFNWFNDATDSRFGKSKPLFTAEEFSDSEGRFSNFKFECNDCTENFETYLYNGNIPTCPHCNPRPLKSKLEEELILFIREHYSGTIRRSNRSVLKDLELDVYLPDLNIAFEMNGVYWHSTQFKFDKNYHLNKTERCEKLGVHLIHIFEDDWKNKTDIIKSRITSLIGKSPTVIYARKCEVKEVSPTVKRDFLDANHIQGRANSSKNYGLYYEKNLVALMTFGKPRFNKNYQWELIRFCSLRGTNVVAGASRLLAHFIRDCSPENILSYADRCWSQGNLYEKLGFELVSKTSPSYSYVISGNRENRNKFQKHKLDTVLESFDPNLSEWKNMENHKFFRIFDCGNLVYKMTI
jgi:hypothetical protein